MEQIVSLSSSLIIYFLFPYVYYFGCEIKKEPENASWIKQLIFFSMVLRVLILWIDMMATINLKSFVILLPISLFCADFIAGMVHLIGDVTDQKQFIKHHKNPTYMCDKTYLHHTFRSYVLINILLLFSYFNENNFWIMTFMWALQANETHVWLHCFSDAPFFVKFLQRFGLLMTPESHRRHHRDSHDRYFCTLNGWANSFVNIFANKLYKIKANFEINKKVIVEPE